MRSFTFRWIVALEPLCYLLIVLLSIPLNKLPWSDLLLLILNSLFSSCSSSLILFFCQHQLNCSDSVCTMLNIMVAKLQDTLVSTCSCWRTLEKAQPQKINIEFFYLRILCLWLYLCCLLILYILLLLHADTTVLAVTTTTAVVVCPCLLLSLQISSLCCTKVQPRKFQSRITALETYFDVRSKENDNGFYWESNLRSLIWEYL